MPPKGVKVVATNRKAHHDYEILETFEAGLVLKGSEVKSLRTSAAQLREAYGTIDGGEVWLHGMHIAPYAMASTQGGHDVVRKRKLLLHRREIEELVRRLGAEPLTLVPTAVYFKDGRAKVELGLARGKRKYDKRQAIAKRDAARDTERELARRHRS